MATFDAFFAEHNLTREERTALVWRLAAIRMQRLLEKLLPDPYILKPEDVLRESGSTETKE